MAECIDLAHEHVGRTGRFPAFGTAVLNDAKETVVTRPGSSESTFVSSLCSNPANTSTIVSPVEPSLSEIEQFLHNRKSRHFRTAVFGALHPASTQAGRATDLLRENGVVVNLLDYSPVVSEADRRWWVWARDERPYIHLKISLSTDGAVVINRRTPTRLASPPSHRYVHRLRGQHDGLLIGAGTVRQDDPQMTYRGDEGYSQPTKIILSRTGLLSKSLKVFEGAAPIVVQPDHIRSRVRALARAGLTSILVEGGLMTYRLFLDRLLWDELSLVWTPVVSTKDSEYLDRRLPMGRISQVGNDIWETVRVRVVNRVRRSSASQRDYRAGN